MNHAQKYAYWSRWQRCAAYFKTLGLVPAQIEAKRHTLTEKALGHPKSMADWKRWTNAEVDKVFAAFAAIYDGGNLDAQLAAIDQPKNRSLRVIDECRALVGTIKDISTDDPDFSDVVDRYLNSLARRTQGKIAELCDDTELNRIKGILRVQIQRDERAMQAEATKATKDQPF